MTVQIKKSFFKNQSDVMEDLKASGFWPTTFVSGPSPEPEIHWHSEEVHAYVMEGETSFLDAETGESTPISPGDKIVVPSRTLHAEGEVLDRVVYIIAIPDAVPPNEFLKVRSPKEL